MTAVDESRYTLRLARELPVYLENEEGYDFEAYEWPWKTDISACTGSLFRLCVSEYNVLFILKVILVIHAADSSCWPTSSSKVAFC